MQSAPEIKTQSLNKDEIKIPTETKTQSSSIEDTKQKYERFIQECTSLKEILNEQPHVDYEEHMGRCIIVSTSSNLSGSDELNHLVIIDTDNVYLACKNNSNKDVAGKTDFNKDLQFNTSLNDEKIFINVFMFRIKSESILCALDKSDNTSLPSCEIPLKRGVDLKEEIKEDRKIIIEKDLITHLEETSVRPINMVYNGKCMEVIKDDVVVNDEVDDKRDNKGSDSKGRDSKGSDNKIKVYSKVYSKDAKGKLMDNNPIKLNFNDINCYTRSKTKWTLYRIQPIHIKNKKKNANMKHLISYKLESPLDARYASIWLHSRNNNALKSWREEVVLNIERLKMERENLHRLYINNYFYLYKMESEILEFVRQTDKVEILFNLCKLEPLRSSLINIPMSASPSLISSSISSTNPSMSASPSSTDKSISSSNSMSASPSSNNPSSTDKSISSSNSMSASPSSNNPSSTDKSISSTYISDTLQLSNSSTLINTSMSSQLSSNQLPSQNICITNNDHHKCEQVDDILNITKNDIDAKDFNVSVSSKDVSVNNRIVNVNTKDVNVKKVKIKCKDKYKDRLKRLSNKLTLHQNQLEEKRQEEKRIKNITSKCEDEEYKLVMLARWQNIGYTNEQRHIIINRERDEYKFNDFPNSWIEPTMQIYFNGYSIYQNGNIVHDGNRHNLAHWVFHKQRLIDRYVLELKKFE